MSEDRAEYQSGAAIAEAPMTPEEMLQAWRGLLAKGIMVDWSPYAMRPTCTISTSGALFQGTAPDPLLAFSKAYRAYQAAQEEKL